MASSGSADALCDQARGLMKERRFEEAHALYNQALELDSRNLPAHEGAAATAFALKAFDKAAAHYKKLSMLDVRRADPLVNLGAVYNRMGEYDNAARTLRQAIAKDRKSAAGYYNLGIAYKGQNQLSMAISAYKEAIRLDPTAPEGFQNLGNVFLEMGNHQQAVRQFERALEINPNFEKARRGLQKAHDAQEEAKRSNNPFGRLVKEDDVSKTQQDVLFRALSPQERFDDRQTLHQLAKETQNLAVAVTAVLREELGPAILRVQQTSAQSGDVRALYRETQQTSTAAARFVAVSDALRSKTESIRQHELVVRGTEGRHLPPSATAVPQST